MKETIQQNAIATEKALNAVVKKFDLNSEKVFEIFYEVWTENMQYKEK